MSLTTGPDADDHPHQAAAIYAQADYLLTHDSTGFPVGPLRELGRCRPVGAGSGELDRMTPFDWAAWVVSAACRAALDHCYDATWADQGGVAELTGLITPSWACPDRDILGFLAALAAGARGRPAPAGSVATSKVATVAGLVVFAWARTTHAVDPIG